MKISVLVFTVACIVSSGLPSMAQAAKNVQFEVKNEYVIGGDDRWDLLALDSKRHHLFVSRSTHVQVIDTESGQVVGDIPDTDGVHGIAVAEEFNAGFTSNGKSNSVTVFDLATLKVIGTVKISGTNPDVIFYEPKSRHIFTFNGHSENATVIDPASRKEIATIRLPGKPEIAVADDAGNIYVNIEDKNEIAVIDSGTNTVLKTYPLGHCTEPTGLAIDKEHHRLFSVCANKKMDILDSETGKMVTEVPIGSGPDSAAFDSKLGIAFSSNGDGTLTLVKENSPHRFAVIQNIPTRKGARTMAYDADSHTAYLVTASFGPTPVATSDQPKPRPSMIPNSFRVIVVSPNTSP